jgi:4-amino-4-deoxy-L-arabinose transferase-like glycosyltransferase
VLLVLWFVFYGSFTLLTPPLLDDADSVHAEVAREMLLRHDWTTLYANGIRYLEKAPLFYWSMAACMKVLGATTVASRLPLAFAVLALVLVLEAFARRAFLAHGPDGERGSARAGLYAGLITLSSFGIFIFSRINIPDVMVCLWLTLALFAYFVAEQSDTAPRRWMCSAFALACALNILTKGLIGIVFPVGIVVAHLLATRGWRGLGLRLRQFHPASSILVFLVVAVPWHVLAGLANPGQGHPGGLRRVAGHWQVPYPTDGNVHGWTWFYFVNEQVYRYLNLRVPHDYDTAPLLVFYGLILVWLMPWSAYLFPALARAMPLRPAAYRTRLRRFALTPAERTNLLLLLWAAIPLVFFSLSTRQEYYVLPSLPPMILLIAAWLAERNLKSGEAKEQQASGLRLAGSLAILGAVAAAVCLYFILHTRAPAADTDLASLLQQNPGDYALSFGHFLDLNATALGLFRLPLALTAVALAGGTLANFLLRRRKQHHAATLALAAGAFLFLFAAHQGLVIFSPTLTSYQLARAIAPEVHPQDLIVLHGEYEAGSTLGFYLRRTDLHIVEGRSSNLWYGSFFPDAPRIFETRASIAQRWRGPRRIFLWQDPHDAERPPLALPAPVYVLAASGGKQILSNQPNR